MEKSSRKKILISLTRWPFPAVDGTRKRILNNVIKALAPSFDLEFLVVSDENPTKEQRSALESFGPVTAFKSSRLAAISRSLAAFISGEALQINYYYNRVAALWLEKNAQRFDILYFHTIRWSKYFNVSSLDKDKVVVDFNDAISLNYEEARNQAAFPWNIIYSIEKNRVLNAELGVLAGQYHFLIISTIDKEYLQKKWVEKHDDPCPYIKVISFGIDEEAFFYECRFGQKFGFMGNLLYPPNADAVSVLGNEIIPNLSLDTPDLRCLIIGGGNQKLVKRYPKLDFLGYLEYPYQYLTLEQCSLFLAPLRFGAGIPTKILEAMALGIPVLTTPLGARWIDFENRQAMIIESLNKWPEKIRQLMKSPDELRSIGKIAKKYAQNYHSNKAIAHEYHSFMESLNQ